MEDKEEFDPRTLSHVVTATPVAGSYQSTSKRPLHMLGWLNSILAKVERALARCLGWPSMQRSKKRRDRLEKEIHALLSPSKQKKGG